MPRLIALADEDEVKLAVGPHRGHLRAVLVDAWPILDQHQVDFVIAEARLLLLDGSSGSLLEQVTIPTSVRRTRGLERPVSSGDLLVEPIRRRGRVAARSDEPTDEEHDGEHPEDDGDNGEDRHRGEYADPMIRPRPPCVS